MKRIAISFIWFYRKYLSGLKRPCCRFYPSCSAYALEAFSKYGFFKAFYMAAKRILRCNPLNAGGYDPLI